VAEMKIKNNVSKSKMVSIVLFIIELLITKIIQKVKFEI